MFPTTPILDDFNRSDESPISDGGKWSYPLLLGDGFFSLVSHQLISTNGSAIWTDQTWSNVECYFTIPNTLVPVAGFSILTNVVGLGASPYPNCIDIGYNFYGVGDSLNYWEINGFNGHSGRVIADFRNQQLIAGDTVGARVLNGSITIFRKTGGVWSIVGTVAGLGSFSAGWIGIDASQSGTAFTDFGGGAPVIAPPNPVIVSFMN
jgi:hypothetical protein